VTKSPVRHKLYRVLLTKLGKEREKVPTAKVSTLLTHLTDPTL